MPVQDVPIYREVFKRDQSFTLKIFSNRKKFNQVTKKQQKQTDLPSEFLCEKIDINNVKNSSNLTRTIVFNSSTFNINDENVNLPSIDSLDVLDYNIDDDADGIRKNDFKDNPIKLIEEREPIKKRPVAEQVDWKRKRTFDGAPIYLVSRLTVVSS